MRTGKRNSTGANRGNREGKENLCSRSFLLFKYCPGDSCGADVRLVGAYARPGGEHDQFKTSVLAQAATFGLVAADTTPIPNHTTTIHPKATTCTTTPP